MESGFILTLEEDFPHHLKSEVLHGSLQTFPLTSVAGQCWAGEKSLPLLIVSLSSCSRTGQAQLMLRLCPNIQVGL